MEKETSNRGNFPNPIFLIVLLVIFVAAFSPVIKSLFKSWTESGDNSHGLLIIPLSLYIIWQNRAKLAKTEISPGPAGLILVAISILLYVFGFLAEISTVKSLSLVLSIWTIIWSLFGKKVFGVLSFPLIFLILMIPIPTQFYSMATIPLQLAVSKASTIIVSLFGIPILREGNVLHLPNRTLAVVQACSGLRSLMSIVTLCAIFGYWTLSSNILRGLLIVFSIPTAIIVNIIRVVIMILALFFLDFDITKGTSHTIFGILIFFLAIIIVAIMKGILSKWDTKEKTPA